jgi:hypothetical protein
MHTAGARALRVDDNEMSREAVLLQWEQKIEAAERLEEEGRADAALESAEGNVTAAEPGERRPGGRFARVPQDNDSPTGGKPALQLVEPDTAPPGPRFERSIDTPEPAPERRTITITGQPTPARRRRSAVEAQIAQPDRIALWAFLLGLFLVAVAAGTAHA